MRVLSLLLLSAGVASAADVYTQKPEAAPSVEVTTLGADPVKPAAAPGLFAKAPPPFWVWGPDQTKGYVLRKEFINVGTTEARVRVTCDNRFVLFVNGKQVASSTEWQSPVEVDITKQLVPGDNVLEAEVVNDGGQAGFVLQMASVTDKGLAYIVSDASWTASRKRNDPKGPPAKLLAKYGDQPWGTVFDGAVAGPGARVPANTFVTLPGFKVERLFTVPKTELGSWVCMTFDDKGRIIASDQDGKGLCRITPPKIGTTEDTKVERLAVKITAAQGMLFHKGTLYVVCNGGPGSGLYRVTASKGDDAFDAVERLKALPGGGEHGPHGIRLGPDGKSLYIMCGNHTQPPQNFDSTRVPRNWGEDLLLPRNWDANGHARGILAPGGYVTRTDLDGKRWDVFSIGYRNAYDLAFNADGELFTYDSDMEWDMGMPWYRPTRVSHVTDGSEFGWRSGTGVWPNHYPDGLPPLVEIGPGSPVGVEFGYGTRFPAKYQKALYCCDWTFGTIYAIHTEPSGGTYTGVKEEFLSRTPLPLTDIGVGPDGALYFTVGGRGTQSELFRVTYVGKEPIEQVEYKTKGDDARELRRKLEAFHERAGDPVRATEFVYPHLGHPDRFVRYAARVALEHQPVSLWQGKVLAEKDPEALLTGMVALARQGEKALQPQMVVALGRLFAGKLTVEQFTDLCRVYSLVFIRTGEPDQDTAAAVLKRLDAAFPAPDDRLNRELVQLLVYLKSPTVLGKTIQLLQQPSKPLTAAEAQNLLARNRGYGGTIANMLKNSADQQKLHYLFVLRNVTEGWTPEYRKVFYGYLAEARSKSGGASYQGFLNQIDNDAFANATDAERLAIEAAGYRKPFRPKGELPKPAGPGKAWTVADLAALEPKLKGRNFKNGERAFAAARCVVCHRFGGDGGATGPDLTQAAGRFTLKDLSESIVEPSKVVSDQYRASVVSTASGKTVTGRVVSEANGKLVIVTDPEDSTKVVEVAKTDVESMKPSAVSLMPDKLIDQLNEDEVLDLLAYLLSRGDPTHPMFKK